MNAGVLAYCGAAAGVAGNAPGSLPGMGMDGFPFPPSDAASRQDAAFLRVSLSPVTGDPAYGALRHPPDEPEVQNLDYIERHDTFTIYYDVFWSVEGERIIALGPPMSQPVRKSLRVLAWPDMAPCEATIRQHGGLMHAGYVVTTIRPPDPATCSALVIEVMGQRYVTPIQPGVGPYMAGARVMLIKNLNNELIWIRDCVEFHAREFGFNAVVLYDNRSDRYSPGEVERVLCRTPGITRVAVVDLQAMYGPVYTARGDHCSRAAHLQRAITFHGIRRMAPLADLVMHSDIDELLVAEQPSRFRALLEDPAIAQLIVGGRTILASARPGAPLRHREYARQEMPPGRRAGKWIARPHLVPEEAVPVIHRINRCPSVD
ncbi:MAG: hypothetical protein ACR2J8_01340, partial [Thermomicrobiales bacterium]